MPQLSSRASGMQSSPLRKLAGIAEDRKKKGTVVHHLNIGQPDLATPQEFLDGVRDFSDNPIAYAMSQGTENAIDGWRTYYKGLGIELSREEVMVTTGGSEALIFALMAVTDPGDNVLVFEPFYTNYNSFGTLAGVSMKPVTLSIDNNFHLPTDEEIEAAIDSGTKAMMVCNPSNPTGTVFTREELQRLVDIATKHDIFIIADEVYREFVFEGEVVSMMEFAQASDRIIMCDSASKRFNACGIRIGTLVSRNADVMAAALKLGMARLSVATIEQMALVPVLENASEIVPPVFEEYRKRRDVIHEGLQAIDGVKAAKPEGAFYIICELPVDSSEEFAKWMIAEFEHEGETVLVAPAPGFYASEGRGLKEIRIAYVLDSQKLKRALELLQIAIDQYNSK
jgi:aspartate aminotransferase